MAMEIVLVDKISGQAVSVDPNSGGLIVTARALGYDHQYQTICITGVIAAALAAGSTIFAMRNSPTANPSSQMAHIQRIRLMYTTLTAFTTPVTAGRRLELFKGSGAAASGGNAISAANKKVSSESISACDSANGGDIRIASTGALTVTGITFEATPLDIMTLSHVGASGAYYEKIIDYTGENDQPIELAAGELLAVRNTVQMDAGGTFQLGVMVDWYEG